MGLLSSTSPLPLPRCHSPPPPFCRINGLTHLNLTKLDVLSGLDEIRVGVGYRTPAGDLLPCFPQNLELLEACEVGASIV